MIDYQEFENVDIRVGKILEVEDFPQARAPSYKLVVDFGSQIGQKKSSAQLAYNYTKEELNGKLVAAVINFPAKQIGPFISEVLIVGFPDPNGHAILITPTKEVPLGGKLF